MSGVILAATPDKTMDRVALEQIGRQVGTESALYLTASEIVAAIRRGETVSDVPQDLAPIFSPADPSAVLVVVEGMSHVLKSAPPGDTNSNLRSYGDPSFDVPGQLVDSIVRFIAGD